MLTWIDHFPGGWFIRLALRRLTSQWRSLVTIIVGVLLAAVVGANVPLYTTAISQVGMLQRLEQQPVANTQIAIRTSLTLTQFEDLMAAWATFDSIVAEQAARSFAAFPNWHTQTISWGESANLLVVRNGEDVPGTRMRIGFYDSLEAQVEIVAGTWPTNASSDQADIEVALHEEVAEELGVGIGDVLVLDQRGWDTSIPIRAQITALLRERDPESIYWMPPSPLGISRTPQWSLEALALTTRENVTRIVTNFIPQTFIQNGWRILFDHTNLPFALIPQVTPQLDDFDNNVREALEAYAGGPLNYVYTSSLSSTLTDYAGEVKILGAPFGLVLLQLGALVLFFIVATAALVRRGERREIAVMQSRGMYDRQIILLRGIEALIIVILAVVIAPALSRQLLMWLIPLFTGIERLPLVIEGSAYGYAAAAALLALLVLIATLLPVLRLPLILAGGSATRSEGQTWWQRYYLDIVVLVIGLAALWRLTSTESLLVETQIGSTQVDPLLLFAPTLLFVGLGSLSLRLFPPFMDVLARYFARTGRVESVLAGWQVSREPLHYGRITFLLALAIGIGWFAITFQSTMTRSQGDQGGYRVGTDVRLIYGDARANEGTLTDGSVYAALPEVENLTLVTRFRDVNVSIDPNSLTQGEMLAVDTDNFAEVVYWRDDLGNLPLPHSSDALPTSGRELPSDTAKISFWGYYEGAEVNPLFSSNSQAPQIAPRPVRLLSEIFVAVRVRDERGYVYHVLARPIPPDQAANNTTEALPPPTVDDPAGILAQLAVTNATMRAFGEFTNLQLLMTERRFAQSPYPDWVQFEVDLTSLESAPQGAPQGSLRMDGIVFNISPGFGTTYYVPSKIQLAELEFINTAGGSTTSDWLTGEGWSFANERATTLEADGMGVVEAASGPSPTALTVNWRQVGAGSTNSAIVFGLMLDYAELITIEDARSQGVAVAESEIRGIPAVISESFAELNSLQAGQKFKLFVNGSSIWFEVTDITRYYPTLYNAERPFIVFDRDMFIYTLQRRPQTALGGVVDEIWIDLTDGTSEADFIEANVNDPRITQVIALQETLNALQTDLLSLGLIGLLLLSFLIGLVLSIVTLFTYISLAVQARKTEFAVLRALGLAPRRLIASIALEQSFVLFTAALLGAVIGVILSNQVLPTLSINTTGGGLVPPFIVQVDGRALLQYGLILALIMVFILLIGSILVRRLGTAQALRVTEE